MGVEHPAHVGLLGRRDECGALDELLAVVRGGNSAVLVVRGEAGVGKSALLEYALEHAAGCQIARASGVESDGELAFAGLHQLCGPMLDRLENLPAPQRDALGTAFGLSAGDRPDRFLVGLAVLNLLAEVAEGGPLVCLVDDAQWLDKASAQTLAFVSRRLLAERIGLVFALRDPNPEHALMGLPELPIRGLGYHDAAVLLDSVTMGPIDERVRDRIISETHGNPLALLELPRGLTPTELAGGFALPSAIPLANRLEQGFMRRLEPLAADARRLLLVAAAEPTGEVTLLWRAAEALGIETAMASAVEAAGLMEVGARVRFRHPLVRSAVYRSSTPAERRGVHRALAEVTDAELEPDRRAWHLAHAADGPGEAVADELERCAGRAQARGGLAAAAAFLERASTLTRDPGRRAQRALDAAQAKHQAGAPEGALALLGFAQTGRLDELQLARVELVRAQIAFASIRGHDAPGLLLNAAKRLESLDKALARETYLEAFAAAFIVGRLSRGVDLIEVAKAARAAPEVVPPRACDVLLDGLALLVAEGRGAATPILRRAVTAFRTEELPDEKGLRWLWLAGRVAQELWDDETLEALSVRHVQLARRAGALTELPIALRSRTFVHTMWGELSHGEALIGEVQAVSAATGTRLSPYGAVALSAWRGREEDTTSRIHATIDDVTARGEGMGVAISHYAAALLYNGLRRHEEAMAAAARACEHEDLGVVASALAELIEAATRTDERDVAAGALERLSLMTSVADTDWALGVEARSRALIADDDAAEALFREAIDRLGRTRVRAELARSYLLFGEWLRRTGRQLDAREQLRIAHAAFSSAGARAFAERARQELEATGETVRMRSVETLDDLTPQEVQIARLAVAGLTNPEIAAQLFLSPRTVEWHLRKLFTKLGIGSRKELRDAMPATKPAQVLPL